MRKHEKSTSMSVGRKKGSAAGVIDLSSDDEEEPFGCANCCCDGCLPCPEYGWSYTAKSSLQAGLLSRRRWVTTG